MVRHVIQRLDQRVFSEVNIISRYHTHRSPHQLMGCRRSHLLCPPPRLNHRPLSLPQRPEPQLWLPTKRIRPGALRPSILLLVANHFDPPSASQQYTRIADTSCTWAKLRTSMHSTRPCHIVLSNLEKANHFERGSTSKTFWKAVCGTKTL